MPNFIRWMLPMDLPDAVEIDRQSYKTPWSSSQISEAINAKHQIGFSHTAVGGLVDGYVVYRIEQGCLQLLRLGVLRDSRRQGVGRQLIEHLQSKLNSKHPWLGAWMDERDAESLLFLKAVGFTPMDHLDIDGVVVMRLAQRKPAIS